MSHREPVHIKAKPGDIAEFVIAAGDPQRVEFIAKNILEDARVVNVYRGYLTYTGYYRGLRVTVATHGIGAPSAAIAIEELVMLGARVITRLGTCGGITDFIDIGDFVIATGAHYQPGGTIGMYVPDGVIAPVPDFELTKTLVETAKSMGLKFHVGPVVSSDSFYSETTDFAMKWAARGALAVEMECAILFTLGLLKKIKTAAILIVSDSVKKKGVFLSSKELEPYVERACKVILESYLKLRP